MNRVYIKTYGCQMNERDSEAVAAMLRGRGYAITGSEREADIILLNTCSVRDLAEQKALGKMSLLSHLKRQNPNLILGFMGCMAQSRGAELLENPAVNLVVGTQRFHHVPDYLDRIVSAREEQDLRKPYQIVDVADEAGSESTIKDHMPEPSGEEQVSAYVSIMQGCDMYCSFCIVPYTRGSERSRPIAEIVDEVRRLVEQDVREVTLLGQIVTSYGRATIPRVNGKTAFVQLLEALNGIDGLERIRFTSPHPKGFGDDLVAAYGELSKLCEHAHLPLQSGSNKILKVMNRGYSREWFAKITDKLRTVRPEIALTTDLIVGFPGESAEDFEETMMLVREVNFDQGYIFKYSPRRDTPAAELADQLSDDEKDDRNQRLLGLINELALRKNEALLGKTVEIFVEGRSEKGPKRMTGRTRTNKIVLFEGSERHRGELLPVKIERATTIALYGDPAIHNL